MNILGILEFNLFSKLKTCKNQRKRFKLIEMVIIF